MEPQPPDPFRPTPTPTPPPFQQEPPPIAQYWTPPPESRDLDHLKILAICHYVWGGLTILFSSIFIIHAIIGFMMLKNPNAFGPMPTTVVTSQSGGPPVAVGPPMGMFGCMFAGMGTGAVLLGWTLGTATIFAGRMLAKRRRRIFCIVIASINCLSVPFGTALGVFTIIVLARDSTKQLFATTNGR